MQFTWRKGGDTGKLLKKKRGEPPKKSGSSPSFGQPKGRKGGFEKKDKEKEEEKTVF